MQHRKMTIWATTLIVLCAVAVRAEQTPARQLGRGVTNVVAGILEVPANIHHVTQEHGGWAGITWGFFRGVYRFAIREGVGVYEIATCAKAYKPIIEPEFPFQNGNSTKWRVNPDFREEY